MSRQRECGTKKQHEYKQDAYRHLNSLVRRTGAWPKTYWVYRCSHCRYWHVGHLKRRRRAN